MKYVVVVFSSRNDSMTFYNIIKRYGGFCSIINTPHAISRACGISVKISGSHINIAKQILATSKFPTFTGIYEISITNGHELSNKIY